MQNLSDLLAVAQQAAVASGDMLRAKIHMQHRIEYKGEIDIVTEADKASEAMIIASLREAAPTIECLAEETATGNTIPANCWIIDPLDGTTNYAHRYPVFCVSIALRIDNEEKLGVIYNPMLSELFSTQIGRGAFLNGRRIFCSQNKDLDKSLLATGFPYDIRTNPDNNLNYFNILAKRVRAIRRAGAAALDLAYLAAGRFDGFWELRLKPWDTAAGALLVKEAGGQVSDLTGNAFSLASPHILASNGYIQEALREALRAAE